MENLNEMKSMVGKIGNQLFFYNAKENHLYTESEFNEYNSHGYFGKLMQKKTFKANKIQKWIWKLQATKFNSQTGFCLVKSEMTIEDYNG